MTNKNERRELEWNLELALEELMGSAAQGTEKAFPQGSQQESAQKQTSAENRDRTRWPLK